MIFAEPVPVSMRALFYVEYRHLGTRTVVIAYSVGYEIVDFPNGLRGVACQIVYDPDHPLPTEDYLAENLDSLLLFPRDLLKVRPYQAPG
jgi:hypothetical protein